MWNKLLQEINADAMYKTIMSYILAGVGTGMAGEWLQSFDIILGIALKSLGIVSFIIGIILSIPKLIDMYKNRKKDEG